MAGALLTPTKVSHRSRGIVRLNCTLLTDDADGSIAVTAIGAAFGKVVGILYDAGDLATGVDITVSDVRTGAVIFTGTDLGTGDLLIRPSILTAAQTKAAQTPAAGLVVNADIYVAGDLQVVVAGGGNAKAGKFDLIVDEGARAA